MKKNIIIPPPLNSYLDKIRLVKNTLFIAILMFSNITFAQYWNLNGNSGTTNSNFIGTTDSIDLRFKSNNQSFMRLTTNGNLILGTASDNYKLSLFGKDNDVFTQWSNVATYDGVNDGFIIGLYGGSADAIIKQQENAPILFFTNGNNERLRINANGFIGINNPNPTAQLDVIGTIRFRSDTNTNRFFLVSDAQGNASWQVPSLVLNSNQLTLNGFSAVDLSQYLDNTDNQDLSLSGNTLSLTNDATPVDLSVFLDNTDAQTLSLTGHQLSITGGNDVTLPDNVDDADADPNNELITSVQLNGNNLEITDAGGTKTVDLSYFDNSSMNIDDADADPTNEIQDLSLNGNILKITNNSNATNIDLSGINPNYWTKTSSGKLYYNNGYVGIGLNAPSRQLQIYSDVNETSVGAGVGLRAGGDRFETDNYKSTILLTNLKTGKTENDGLKLESKNKNGLLRLQEAGELALLVQNYGIRIKQDGNLKFDKLAGSGQRLVIADAQGNISAIETNSLADNLGNHTATQNLNMSNKKIYNVNALTIERDHGDWVNLKTSTGKNWSLHNHFNEGTLRFSYHYNGNDDWNILVLDGNTGNVGIGTSQPREKLSVQGNAQNIEISNTEETEAGIILNDAQGPNVQYAKILFNSSSNNLSFYINNSDEAKFVIKSNGNVGVGTNNPFAKLEIVNNDNNISSFNIYANTGDYSYSMVTNIQHEYVKNYVIKLNGHETFRVYGNGMVEATDVWVSEYTDFPDYVFEPTYKKLNLSELEQFIIKNKHLPEIPSAKKVESEGVSLKDMNTLLLKKVEELTLYIIDLQKQINELKEK